jgi:hypothetical protein
VLPVNFGRFGMTMFYLANDFDSLCSVSGTHVFAVNEFVPLVPYVEE